MGIGIVRIFVGKALFFLIKMESLFTAHFIFLSIFPVKLLLKLYLTILNHTEHEASTAHVYCISGSANVTSTSVYFFGTLGRVHSPLYHSKLANNSEHPVLISFVCNFHD